MAQPDADTKYFATTNESITDSTAEGIWLKENSDHSDEKVINLGGVEITDSGSDEYTGTDTYGCTYTITLKKESDDTMIGSLQDGDVILNITGGADVSEGTNFDLKNLGESKDFTSTFDLKTSDSSKIFEANLYLMNKTEEQNHLKDKKLSLKFETNAKCTIKTTE